ncbi:MAG TPA: hypothetical protein VFD46_08445 [Chryseolinea sp.]|nr:hypothetical protein [Chryseolinea sp.]
MIFRKANAGTIPEGHKDDPDFFRATFQFSIISWTALAGEMAIFDMVPLCQGVALRPSQLRSRPQEASLI